MKPPKDAKGITKNSVWEGGQYTGELWNNIYPHGHGSLALPNGETYVGHWEMGHRKGEGVLTYSNGDVYVGKFEDDMRDCE